MSINEYSGERILIADEVALDPTNRESNTVQYDALEEQLVAVLKSRSITPTPWFFHRSHYTHGGVTTLYVRYSIEKHKKTLVDE